MTVRAPWVSDLDTRRVLDELARSINFAIDGIEISAPTAEPTPSVKTIAPLAAVQALYDIGAAPDEPSPPLPPHPQSMPDMGRTAPLPDLAITSRNAPIGNISLLDIGVGDDPPASTLHIPALSAATVNAAIPVTYIDVGVVPDDPPERGTPIRIAPKRSADKTIIDIGFTGTFRTPAAPADRGRVVAHPHSSSDDVSNTQNQRTFIDVGYGTLLPLSNTRLPALEVTDTFAGRERVIQNLFDLGYDNGVDTTHTRDTDDEIEDTQDRRTFVDVGWTGTFRTPSPPSDRGRVVAHPHRSANDVSDTQGRQTVIDVGLQDPLASPHTRDTDAEIPNVHTPVTGRPTLLDIGYSDGVSASNVRDLSAEIADTQRLRTLLDIGWTGTHRTPAAPSDRGRVVAHPHRSADDISDTQNRRTYIDVGYGTLLPLSNTRDNAAEIPEAVTQQGALRSLLDVGSDP